MTAASSNPRRRDTLLELARRLGAAAPPHRDDDHHDPLRPGGRLSFAEFLLQWPCEVELPTDLSDRAFIDAAYRAILLRAPQDAEVTHSLRLREGGASPARIVEALLASAELRALERMVRVRLGDMLITDPAHPEVRDMPAVPWPWRAAD